MPRLSDQRLYALKPDLEESRRGADGELCHLVVWGALPAWMAMDDELRSLLRRFDGRRTVSEILASHARERGRPPAEVAREASPLLDDLRRRGVLRATPGAPRPDPEAVRIANVTLNLTNRCNLSCSFCYNDRRAQPEMAIQPLMDGIEQSRALLAEDASFIVLGGEPLLDPERLMGALARAEAIFKAPVLLSTNGTRVTDAVVDLLRERRVQVQISLDGPEAAQHDAVRGRGVFDQAVSAVRRLRAAGVYTMLSMVYTRCSFSQMEAYLELARALDANEARFIPMRTIGKGIGCQELRPNQLVCFEHLLAILERRPELSSLLIRDYFSILATQLRFSARRTSCGIGRKVVFIDADGSVYPCPNHVLPSFRAGHLERESLSELVLRSPVFCATRESYQVERYTRCRDCAFRFWCAGDCRGEVLACSGGPHGPSPHCEQLRDIFRRILWLLATRDMPLGAQRRVSGGGEINEAFL